MKRTTTVVLPSADKRWKIVDAKMRRFAHQPHALIETLYTAQEAFGFLDDETLRFVAHSLHVPLSKVYGVATFYNFFKLKPKGKHTCIVCLGTACYVKGANQIVRAIEAKADITVGETTKDRRLSLLTVRCIGACSLAPAVIYDGQVASRQTPEDAIERIEDFMQSGTGLVESSSSPDPSDPSDVSNPSNPSISTATG